MANPAYQPIIPLSEAKLETFLRYVSRGTLTSSDIRRALLLPSGQLNVLETLIPLYTSRVSWGSLAYHYSRIPINSLAPDDVFEKLVVKGLSGHCLEMVPLFASVLLSLGYDLYMTGARISSVVAGYGNQAGFNGWSHIVLIVTISGQKYVVDPQFIEIVKPVPLITSGRDVIFNGVPSTIMRLRYCLLSDVIPHKASNSGLKTWLFEFKHSTDAEEWSPAYIFSHETEWYLEDLAIINTWLAKAAESYLVTQFIIKRVLLAGADDAGSEFPSKPLSASLADGFLTVPKISGFVELAHDHLRVFNRGKKVIDEMITTEQERIAILKTWFGIELVEADLKAIKNPLFPS